MRNKVLYIIVFAVFFSCQKQENELGFYVYGVKRKLVEFKNLNTIPIKEKFYGLYIEIINNAEKTVDLDISKILIELKVNENYTEYKNIFDIGIIDNKMYFENVYLKKELQILQIPPKSSKNIVLKFDAINEEEEHKELFNYPIDITISRLIKNKLEVDKLNLSIHNTSYKTIEIVDDLVRGNLPASARQ